MKIYGEKKLYQQEHKNLSWKYFSFYSVVTGKFGNMLHISELRLAFC